MRLIARGLIGIFVRECYAMKKTIPNIQKNFGLNVRSLRKAKGLSQEALAAEAELDRTYLGREGRKKRKHSEYRENCICSFGVNKRVIRMSYAYENVRLNELAAIADTNKGFYDDFISFIKSKGYGSVFKFIFEEDDTKVTRVILGYLKRELPKGIELYDSIARPYKANKVKWLFLGWRCPGTKAKANGFIF